MCIKTNIRDLEMANDKELKQECIKRLEILKFDEKVINDFKHKDKLYVTNMSNKNIVDTTYNEIIKGIKVFERTYNVKIYHILNIESNSKIEVYFLYVKRDKKEWKNERVDLKNGFAEVDYEKCTGCGLCVAECPKHLIFLESEHKVNVACLSTEKGGLQKKFCNTGCVGCKLCEKSCEYDAIHVNNFLASIDYNKCINCGKWLL